MFFVLSAETTEKSDKKTKENRDDNDEDTTLFEKPATTPEVAADKPSGTSAEEKGAAIADADDGEEKKHTPTAAAEDGAGAGSESSGFTTPTKTLLPSRRSKTIAQDDADGDRESDAWLDGDSKEESDTGSPSVLRSDNPCNADCCCCSYRSVVTADPEMKRRGRPAASSEPTTFKDALDHIQANGCYGMAPGVAEVTLVKMPKVEDCTRAACSDPDHIGCDSWLVSRCLHLCDI